MTANDKGMDNQKDSEIAEIKRRLDYLVATDEITDSMKIDILKNALEIIETGELEREVQ